MVNQEHLDILKQGADIWNQWRKEQNAIANDIAFARGGPFHADYIIPDLSSADLSGANLYRTDLSSARLYEANLSGANLSSADLTFANLSSADLRSADLSGANLRDALQSHFFGEMLP